jgi:hypothetical protein
MRSIIYQLTPLQQPDAQTRDIAAAIRDALGMRDGHSAHFHHLVASRVPAKIIHAHLADIRADGARNPGALFTYRMTKYAEERLTADKPSIRDRVAQLTVAKKVP